MNKKGFTLVELLATIVILGVVLGITIVAMNINLNNTKKKTEEVFIGTIKDALEMYLDSDARKLKNDTNEEPVCTINKVLSDDGINIYELYKFDEYGQKQNITLKMIINSTYSPLLESDLVNPNNKGVKCSIAAKVEIYRDEDYVYYYRIKKGDIVCLTLDTENGLITNLPDDCLLKIKD